jgi:hypothetical protein
MTEAVKAEITSCPRLLIDTDLSQNHPKAALKHVFICRPFLVFIVPEDEARARGRRRFTKVYGLEDSGGKRNVSL